MFHQISSFRSIKALFNLFSCIVLLVLTICSQSKTRTSSQKQPVTSKVIGLHTPSLTQLNAKAITCMANTIMQDHTHPLDHYFTLLHSGRIHRTLTYNRARFKSLILSAITTLRVFSHLPCLVRTFGHFSFT